MKHARPLLATSLAASILLVSGVVASQAIDEAGGQPLAQAAEQQVAATARPAAPPEAVRHADQLSRAFREVAQALRPSVVSISSTKRVAPAAQRRSFPEGRSFEFGDEFGFGDQEELLRRFFESIPQQLPRGRYAQQGLGSGVIISTDGAILTNNHVVQGADEVTVKLSDGRSYPAKVVGTDSHTDLAVLKIDAPDLVAAPLGNSSAMRVGDWVLAIGSPMGLAQTVTAGIISATGRANVGIADYEDFLQTDAAINPGNSGGPLVNLRGEVIGINTAIASRTGGNMGIGFAIPSNMARTVKDAILRDGEVQRGLLGAVIQDLTPELAESFNYDSTDGVLVGDVVEDGPAQKAGLKAGDIVTSYGGKPMRSANQLRNTVAATAPGTNIELGIVRSGDAKTLSVKIGELDSSTAQAAGPSTPEGHASRELGLSVATLTPQLASRLGIDEDARGAVVTEVEQGSLAARVGIETGDLVVAIGNQPIESSDDFRSALEDQSLEQGLRLKLERDGVSRFVFLKSRQ